MLTHLRIKNFKAWKNTGSIRLAPLTVIFGANSAGKSSLGHLLLALQQTARSTDRKRALHLGDASSFIDLGTFKDCLHGHDLAHSLEFEMAWTLPKTMEVRDPLLAKSRYSGDRMRLAVKLAAGKSEQPEVQSLEYALGSDAGDELDVSLRRDEKRKLILNSERYGVSCKTAPTRDFFCREGSRNGVQATISGMMWFPDQYHIRLPYGC